MTVQAISVPEESAIASYLPGADFADAFYTDVPVSDQRIEDSYHAIMGSMPHWFRSLFKLRNRLVRPLGLEAPRSEEFNNLTTKSSDVAGEKAGVFTFYGRTDNEFVVGGDDKHLDFRLSVLRSRVADRDRVIVSTLVKTHNIGGKLYLGTIMPFHKLGVMTLLGNAAREGKL